MTNKKFCVIGLGYFGLGLSLALSEDGAEVLAIDRDASRVELLEDKISLAVVADSTDSKSMLSLGIKDMDAVIVAIGEGFEASINTIALLQELEIKNIFARVVSPIHERLLKLMNINELLYPESEAARHLSNRLMIPGLIESFEISNEFGIFEIKIPKNFISHTLIELNLRNKFNLNLVTVKKISTKKQPFFKSKSEKFDVLGVVNPDYRFEDGDILVLFGKETDFKKMLQLNEI